MNQFVHEPTCGCQRPPLGVKPKWIHDELRCLDLSRAIHEYIEAGRMKENGDIIKLWSEELNEIIRNYQRS